MIKLKHILKESSDAFKAIHKNLPAEYVLAWQKPDGTLLPIKYSHPSDAIDYIGGDPRADATVVLWRRGWNRITSGPDKHGTVLYSQNEFMPPNDKQKEELINVAKEKGFAEVVYTSPDDGKPRILWSKHNVLQEEEEEPTKERKSTSWLDHSGKFIPIMGNHHSFAMRITGSAPNPEMVLWKKGWQRITYYSRGVLYAENHIMPPNDIQKAKLIDLVKDLEFYELKYDNGTVRDTILWSKEDALQEVK